MYECYLEKILEKILSERLGLITDFEISNNLKTYDVEFLFKNHEKYKPTFCKPSVEVLRFNDPKLFRKTCQTNINLGRKKLKNTIDSMILRYRGRIEKKIYHVKNVIRYLLRIRNSLDFGNG